MKKELNKDAKVVATGGLAELMKNSDKKVIDVIDRNLTLFGLKTIYELNKEG